MCASRRPNIRLLCALTQNQNLIYHSPKISAYHKVIKLSRDSRTPIPTFLKRVSSRLKDRFLKLYGVRKAIEEALF